MAASFWLLMTVLSLMAIHGTAMTSRILSRPTPARAKLALLVITVLFALLGWETFLRLGIANYLFLRYYNFDVIRPAALYLAEFLAIPAAIDDTASLINRLFGRRRRRP